ncbi:MAG TPA: lamin tail domain-containing protein [Chitinophagaceae bacterium]
MNIFLLLLLLFCNGFVFSQTAKRFDVVIHELLPDPSPSQGLPSSEFIELRNNSSDIINLRNWKITDGSSVGTVSVNFLLQPDSCVVICPSAALAAFTLISTAVGITGFPSLNNDGDMIWLIAPDGSIIHAVSYETGWFRNAVKSEGGWSLEMIDVHNPCGGKDNWIASRDQSGGTPGKKNSAEAINRDTIPPSLIRTYAADSVTIVLLFDEPLDSISATNTSAYKIDNNIYPVQASLTGPLFNQVNLKLAFVLSRDSVYTLTVTGATDCAGNSIGFSNTAKAGLASESASNEIIINEVLFNPLAPGTDYIELFNRSNKVFDAAALYVANRNTTGMIGDLNRLSEIPFYFFPSDHLLFTADGVIVQSQYFVKNPPQIISGKLPSLPDDKGTVVLMNNHGLTVDELAYDEKWHFALISKREGVALERIDPSGRTQDKNNWTSASTDAGYGTPTYVNSQYRKAQTTSGKIEVIPKVFSPDNDGLDDFCFINYHLSVPNTVASITIFDIKGVAVRNLCRNITLSEKGMVRWDGLDSRGYKLPAGIYIIFTGLYDLQGNTANFKNTVTLAGRF